jgi:parallel beta-helix repeat protein
VTAKSRAAILLAAVLLFLCSIPDVVVLSPPVFEPIPNQTALHSSAHVSHEPISIVGNADLLNQASVEGWPGLGTETDPIIISGYSIQHSGHLFRIIETDLYFEFTNNVLDGIDGQWCGLYIAEASHGRVSNNTIYSTAAAIHALWINDTVVTSNVIFGNSNDGIAFERPCYRNNVSWNIIESNVLEGIFFDSNSSENVIHNNLITNTLGSGILLWEDSNSNQVYNNTIAENKGPGLTIRGHHQEVYHNVIANNTQDGILISASFCRFEDNIIMGNSRAGIQIYTFSEERVGNEISGNSILSNGRYGVDIGVLCNNNSIEHNNFIDNGAGPQACDDGFNNLIQHNYWNPWNHTDDDYNGITDNPYQTLGSSENADRTPSLEPFDGLPLEYSYVPNVPVGPPDFGTQGVEGILVVSVSVLIVAVALWQIRRTSST